MKRSFEEMMRSFNELTAAADAAFAESQMTLGKLIHCLARIAPELPVAFSDGIPPGGEASYRGYYNHLAIGDGTAPRTVGELLAQCRGAIGRTYCGYKGGSYTMHADTPLWRDEVGQCRGDAIMAVEVEAGAARLRTLVVDD